MVLLNYPKDKIVKIPNSVELKKFQECKILKKNKETIKFITVDRYYEKKKGLDLIEQVSKYLIEKKINFKWTLVGRDSSNLLKKDFIIKNKNFFEILKEIPNNDEIYFPHSKLIKIYKSHDAYINLARIESFGITLLEAIAAGLPVISFDTKGANELIINNENGILVNEYNPLKMAELIIEKIKDNYFDKEIKNTKIEKYDLEFNSILTQNNY